MATQLARSKRCVPVRLGPTCVIAVLLVLALAIPASAGAVIPLPAPAGSPEKWQWQVAFDRAYARDTDAYWVLPAGVVPEYVKYATPGAGKLVYMFEQGDNSTLIVHGWPYRYYTITLLANTSSGSVATILTPQSGEVACGSGSPSLKHLFYDEESEYLFILTEVAGWRTYCVCATLVDPMTGAIASISGKPPATIFPTGYRVAVAGDANAAYARYWLTSGSVLYVVEVDFENQQLNYSYWDLSALVGYPLELVYADAINNTLYWIGAETTTNEWLLAFGTIDLTSPPLILAQIYLVNLTPYVSPETLNWPPHTFQPLFPINESFILITVNDTVLDDPNYIGINFEQLNATIFYEFPQPGTVAVALPGATVSYATYSGPECCVPQAHVRPSLLHGVSLQVEPVHSGPLAPTATYSYNMSPVAARFTVNVTDPDQLAWSVYVDAGRVNPTVWAKTNPSRDATSTGISDPAPLPEITNVTTDGELAYLSTPSGDTLFIVVPAPMDGMQGYSLWWSNGSYAGSTPVLGLGDSASLAIVGGEATIIEWTNTTITFNDTVTAVLFAHDTVIVSAQTVSLAPSRAYGRGTLVVASAQSAITVPAGTGILLTNITAVTLAPATAGLASTSLGGTGSSVNGAFLSLMVLALILGMIGLSRRR